MLPFVCVSLGVHVLPFVRAAVYVRHRFCVLLLVSVAIRVHCCSCATPFVPLPMSAAVRVHCDSCTVMFVCCCPCMPSFVGTAAHARRRSCALPFAGAAPAMAEGTASVQPACVAKKATPHDLRRWSPQQTGARRR